MRNNYLSLKGCISYSLEIITLQYTLLLVIKITILVTILIQYTKRTLNKQNMKQVMGLYKRKENSKFTKA